MLLLTYWGSKEDDARIEEAVKGALESIRVEGLQNGTALDYVYVNYEAVFKALLGVMGMRIRKR